MPLLLTTSLLIFVFTAISACKRSGTGLDLVTSSIRFIHVGDEVALTFNSRLATSCSITINSQTIQCEKVKQDNNAYYADLGKLSKDSSYPIELEIHSDSIIRHSLNYRYQEHTKADSHYLRFDLQNKVGEIHRGKISSFPSQGCKIANSTKPEQITPMPLHLQRLIMTGFADASASHHTHNKNVARISRSKLNFSNDWDIYLMERQVSTRFILPSPAILQHVSIDNTEISSNLNKQPNAISIPQGMIPSINWEIKNPAPSILLTLKVARDDRSVVGECWVDAGQGMMKFKTSFWQQLTAGKYSIEVMLISPQRVVIQSSGSTTAWQVNAYDWKYGYFNKT